MGIHSYLVIPRPGEAAPLRRRMARLPGCEVIASDDRNLFVLVTDTPDRETDRALRERIEALDGVRALIPTFADVETP